jgi:hypothetical protein
MKCECCQKEICKDGKPHLLKFNKIIAKNVGGSEGYCGYYAIFDCLQCKEEITKAITGLLAKSLQNYRMRMITGSDFYPDEEKKEEILKSSTMTVDSIENRFSILDM